MSGALHLFLLEVKRGMSEGMCVATHAAMLHACDMDIDLIMDMDMDMDMDIDIDMDMTSRRSHVPCCVSELSRTVARVCCAVTSAVSCGCAR